MSQHQYPCWWILAYSVLAYCGDNVALATSGGQIQTDVAFVVLKPLPKVGDCFLLIWAEVGHWRHSLNIFHAVAATSGTCPFPMALSLSTLFMTPFETLGISPLICWINNPIPPIKFYWFYLGPPNRPSHKPLNPIGIKLTTITSSHTLAFLF